jgi:hypothetical protein
MNLKAELEGDWWQHRRPFLHYRAENVFSHDVYGRLAAAFQEKIGSARQTGKAFGRGRNYDADIIGLSPKSAKSFDPLLSQRWLTSICNLLGLADNRRIDAALHSSLPGSRTGWVHTDYCSGWFDESAAGGPSDLTFPNRGTCAYFTGAVRSETAVPVEYVRAATLIFYLCNDDWRPGAGGETGLYAGAKATEETAVPPRNNSLLLFACGPHSYHRFLANAAGTRNSIIFWLHQSVEEAHARWGMPPRRGRTG